MLELFLNFFRQLLLIFVIKYGFILDFFPFFSMYFAFFFSIFFSIPCFINRFIFKINYAYNI